MNTNLYASTFTDPTASNTPLQCPFGKSRDISPCLIICVIKSIKAELFLFMNTIPERGVGLMTLTYHGLVITFNPPHWTTKEFHKLRPKERVPRHKPFSVVIRTS